jgi:tetratricopeptide (TPR) repeat protein
MAQQKKELGRKLSLPVKIVIVLFAIIMALSMMLPSLAQFFVGNNAQKAQEEATETTEETEGTEGTEGDSEESEGDAAETAGDAEDGEAAEGEGADATQGEAAEGAETAEGDQKAEDATATDADRAAIPNNDTLKQYYDTYKPQVTRYEDKLKEKPESLAALLNAGQAYMNWGYMADYASSSDEEHAYSYSLLNKAVEYFDRYLALNDSKSVHVDHALCLYYMDKTDEAISELEAYSEVEPDYPLVWANLGMLYELMGETEKANEAYKTAAECDPDDEYGAKSYANGRLIELNKKVEGPGDAGEANANKLAHEGEGEGEEAPEPGLTATLAQDTGVGF